MKQILYKKDSLGKLRSLEIIAEGNTMKQISGLLDGKKVEHSSDKKGTNIGRANERSPEQQAIFEANAKIKEKLRTGYFKTKEEALNNEVIKPMLAKKFEDVEDKIDWNNAYAQGKYDGCLKSNSLIRTDKGLLPIVKIVNEKLSCKVASYNQKTKKIEYKPIINWFDNGTTYTSNFRTILCENNEKLTCTLNHEVFTNNGWKKVEDLNIEKDLLYMDTEKHILGLILGIFLGDGNLYLDKRAETFSCKFSFSHSIKQKEYLDYQIQELEMQGNISTYESGYGSEMFLFVARNFKHYYSFAKQLIDNKTGERKTLSHTFLLKYLTKQGLAFLIGDDGSIGFNNNNKYTPILHIGVYRYSDEQIEAFIKYFKIKFKITPTQILDKKCDGYFLNFNTKDTLLLLSHLQDVIPKGVEYKFFFKNKYFIRKKVSEYSFTKIKKLLKVKGSRMRKYDIEVKGNHNYFAENILVHNCRMFDKPEGKFSRTNKLIETVDHIQTVRSLIPDLITDGELMAPNLTFQENSKITKKYRKGQTEMLRHWVYDSVGKGEFTDRYNVLKQVVNDSQGLILAPTYKVTSKDDFLKMNTYFLKQGLEGAMLRWGEESYELNKRSRHLLKYKEFLEMDCLIVDVVPNKANPLHGTIVCQIAAGSFKCGMKMSHAERELVLINKHEYIGQMANVTYFELTDGGLLRFPIFKGIHTDR